MPTTMTFVVPFISRTMRQSRLLTILNWSDTSWIKTFSLTILRCRIMLAFVLQQVSDESKPNLTPLFMKNSKQVKNIFIKANCLPAGVLNISSCLNNLAPIIVSNPHFLNADLRFLNGIKGLSEARDSKHLTNVYIEPTAGMPFQANLSKINWFLSHSLSKLFFKFLLFFLGLQVNVQISKDSRAR